MKKVWRLAVVACAAAATAGLAATAASADLRYRADQTPEGTRFMIVEGGFEYGDDLPAFRATVREKNPAIIGFNSPGGNIVKRWNSDGYLIHSSLVGACNMINALISLGSEPRLSWPGFQEWRTAGSCSIRLYSSLSSPSASLCPTE